MQEPEPDFALSGKLAAETNRVNGVVLLHVEPPEAAVPTQRWRLYQVLHQVRRVLGIDTERHHS